MQVNREFESAYSMDKYLAMGSFGEVRAGERSKRALVATLRRQAVSSGPLCVSAGGVMGVPGEFGSVWGVLGVSKNPSLPSRRR